jgi:hypothetical protein
MEVHIVMQVGHSANDVDSNLKLLLKGNVLHCQKAVEVVATVFIDYIDVG